MVGAGGRMFLLSPTLGLGSGRLLCRWVTSCLGLFAVWAGFASGLWASAAVVHIAAIAPLALLRVLASVTLVLLVLLTVPHWSRTGWTPEQQNNTGIYENLTVQCACIGHTNLCTGMQNDYSDVHKDHFN